MRESVENEKRSSKRRARKTIIIVSARGYLINVGNPQTWKAPQKHLDVVRFGVLALLHVPINLAGDHVLELLLYQLVDLRSEEKNGAEMARKMARKNRTKIARAMAC